MDEPLGARAALLRAAREELALVGTGGISLRAIARRAGVSHAAPKHHFGDRAGLLTALAVEGFQLLLAALEQAVFTAPGAAEDRLAALGRAYVRTGLTNPKLFELMFRADLLHRDDADLRTAQQATFDLLSEAVTEDAHPRQRSDHQPAAALSLIAWAFVHGLVVLTHHGALQAAAKTEQTETVLLVERLTDAFVDRVRLPPTS